MPTPPKSKLLLAALFFLFTCSLMAQSYYKGEGHLHLGIALPYKIAETGDRWQIPPFTLGYEKAIKDRFTLGGTATYASTRTIYYRFLGDHYYHRHQYILGMLRSTYHFELLSPDKFDTYAGLGLGAKVGWSGFRGEGALAEGNFNPPRADSGFVYAIFAGIHYYHSDTWRFFAEIGFGATPVTIGLQLPL